jgi:hypothetical protein
MGCVFVLCQFLHVLHKVAFGLLDRPVASSQAALCAVGPLIPPPPIAPPSQSLGGEGEKITYGVNTYCLLLKNRGTAPEFF